MPGAEPGAEPGANDTDPHERPAEAQSLASGDSKHSTGHRERMPDAPWGNQGTLLGGSDSQHGS